MRKKILKIATIVHKLDSVKKFRFVVCAEGRDTQMKKAGLHDMQPGESRLPAAVGASTRFNAHGKHIVFRQRPKESRYIHSKLWEWQSWGRGPYQSKMVDVYRDCYPREEIVAPSIELALLKYQEVNYLSTPLLSLSGNNEDEILLAINILLELFGEYQIFFEDEGIREIKFKRVNWRMMPPGEKLFEQLISHLKQSTKPDCTQPVVIERQYFLNSFEPSNIYMGLGGFSEYLAYEFKEKNIVILESIKFGNAIYKFGDDWEEFSKLTKKEIISHNLAERVIHTEGWKNQVADILN